jgi:hypothetical protein
MTEETDRVTVHLALAVGSDPIEGSVAVGEEQPRDFQTWFELIAALDAARETTAGRPGVTGLPVR